MSLFSMVSHRQLDRAAQICACKSRPKLESTGWRWGFGCDLTAASKLCPHPGLPHLLEHPPSAPFYPCYQTWPIQKRLTCGLHGCTWVNASLHQPNAFPAGVDVLNSTFATALGQSKAHASAQRALWIALLYLSPAVRMSTMGIEGP